jgi:UDP-glucoronosyl and UDP-glucosyl transferase
MGLLTFWSFVPHHALTYTDNMSFLQRCYNHYIMGYDALVRKFYYIKAQNKLAVKYFNSEDLPAVSVVEKQISIMLVNGHRDLHEPRPKMPRQINIAGAHIRPPKLLPGDQQVILSIN